MKSQIVLRTNLAAVPAKDMDTDRREFSKCLIVPTKNGPLACVTNKMALAVVQVEGDVEKESAFDLSVTQLANLSMPIVVNRDGDETQVFRGMKPQDDWKPLGHTFRVHDESDPKKFPNTDCILTEVEQDNCIVVRLDAVLLLKLAQAICDESDYRMFGSFFDGKGQPSQVSAVSHGSSTTRFNGINVINTARSLG